MQRAASYILVTIAALAGIALACRVLLGPIDHAVPIHSPLNSESVLAVSLLLLAFSRAQRRSEIGRAAWNPFVAGLIIVTAVAAFAWTAHFYFLSDDFLLLNHAKAPFPGWLRLLRTPGGDGFFRPLGYISFLMSAKWAALNPASWHWIEILLHAGNSVLVYALAAAIGYARFAAWLAATLFALHGAHPEAVVWMAGRFDLLATLFVLLGLIAFVRSAEADSPRRLVYQALALVFMLAALLTKESAYAFPLLAILFVACYTDRRFSLTVPFVVVTAAMFIYRWTLFGGIGGYAGQDGRPEAMSLGAISLVKALLLRLWAVLFFPINWSIAPGVIFAVISIAYLIALGALFLARAHLSKLAFAVGFALLSALPAVSQLLIGADLQKSRLVYLPSVGFCLLLAVLLDGFPSKAKWALASVVILFHAAALSHNLAIWQQASVAVRSACAAVAECPVKPPQKILVTGLPNSLNGVYVFANGFRECVAMQPDASAGPGIQIDTQAATADYACRFRWDPKAETLRREPPPP